MPGKKIEAGLFVKLDEKGLNLDIFYIASVELFDRLPVAEQETIFPETEMGPPKSSAEPSAASGCE